MFAVRPAVNLAARLKIKEPLRRFIITPVMKSIDMDEPFEYLTEMRQAVIVFINVISFKLQTEETVILADHTYKTVCRFFPPRQSTLFKPVLQHS
jgi:adenylate cyclase 10